MGRCWRRIPNLRRSRNAPRRDNASGFNQAAKCHDNPTSSVFSTPTSNGAWVLRTPNLVSEPKRLFTYAARVWADTGFVQPGAMYRVTAVYADGREGWADYVYANPPQPQVPTGLAAQQTGPGAVTLSWQPLPYAQMHGDAGRVPARVKAGTASLSGGLQNTDVFPAVLDPAQRYGQASGDQTFPFLIWEGTLTNAYDAEIILPTLSESDRVKNDANQASYTNWFLAESAELPRVWADHAVQQALQGRTILGNGHYILYVQVERVP